MSWDYFLKLLLGARQGLGLRAWNLLYEKSITVQGLGLGFSTDPQYLNTI